MIRREAGFTLVEMMVATALIGVAMAAAFGMGVSVVRTYGDHRRMVLVERSARVSLEMLADAARNASPGIPAGNVGDLVGCSDTGAFRVIDGGQAPDQLEIVYASGGLVTSLRQPYELSSSGLLVLDARGFQPGDQVIVTNLARGHIVPITAVVPEGGAWRLVTGPPSALCPAVEFPVGGYAAGSLVVRARIARFFIDASEATTGGVPTLMMDPDAGGPARPEPLAEGIEDLQVATGVDVDADGTVSDAATTTDEWFGNAEGDAAPPAVVPRALRLSLVAVAAEESNTQPTFLRPAVENHRQASAPDRFRRRVLSTTVEIRNLEGSP